MRAQNDPDSPQAPSRQKAELVLWALGIPVTLIFLNYPAAVGQIGLDQSWMQSLAFLLKMRLHAGTDWIHTYGPLGHFVTVLFDPDLFWPGVVWEIVSKVLLVSGFLILLRPIRNVLARILILILAVLYIADAHPDVHSMILIFTFALILTDPRTEKPVWMVSLITFVFAAYSLTKFVFLVFSFLSVLCAEFQYRREKLPLFVSPVLFYFAFASTLWVLAGQSITNIPAYFRGSIETAFGYVEAMSIPGSPAEIVMAVLIAVSLLAVPLVMNVRWRRMPGIIPVFILFGGLFLAWKHGFVRQQTHAVLFFAYAMFVSLVAPIYFGAKLEGSPWRSGIVCVVVFISIIGSAHGIINSRWTGRKIAKQEIQEGGLLEYYGSRLQRNIHRSLHLAALKRGCETDQNWYRRKWSLPRIRSWIGTETVDIISFEQGRLFLNDLHWTPRPVFQSFHTFTSYLLNANAAFYETGNAPKFILYKLQTLDGRFPALDDGKALITILNRYHPVGTEQSYLLLQRNNPETRTNPLTERLLFTKNIRFAEEVSVDGLDSRFQRLSVRMKESIPGRLRRLFLYPPLLTMNIHTDSQKTFRFRLIPGMAEQGFLLNPILQRTGDFVRLYGDRDRTRIQSFRIETLKGDHHLWYYEKIAVTLTDLSNPTSVPLHPYHVRRLATFIERREPLRVPDSVLK